LQFSDSHKRTVSSGPASQTSSTSAIPELEMQERPKKRRRKTAKDNSQPEATLTTPTYSIESVLQLTDQAFRRLINLHLSKLCPSLFLLQFRKPLSQQQKYVDSIATTLSRLHLIVQRNQSQPSDSQQPPEGEQLPDPSPEQASLKYVLDRLSRRDLPLLLSQNPDISQSESLHAAVDRFCFKALAGSLADPERRRKSKLPRLTGLKPLSEAESQEAMAPFASLLESDGEDVPERTEHIMDRSLLDSDEELFAPESEDEEFLLPVDDGEYDDEAEAVPRWKSQPQPQQNLDWSSELEFPDDFDTDLERPTAPTSPLFEALLPINLAWQGSKDARTVGEVTSSDSFEPLF
jgi:hypothetical protein